MSGALPFVICQSVALDTNDVVFDPFTRKLYASVPSTATQIAGNSIVSIDPLTGALGSPVFIGSEPTRMSISDDGQYLYAVLSGSNSVRRLNLTTLTPGTQFTTISALFGAAFTASDIAPMPGNHDVVATAGYSNGIQVYDVTSTGATQRPLTVGLVNDVYEGSVLGWGSSTDLYSNDEGISPSSSIVSPSDLPALRRPTPRIWTRWAERSRTPGDWFSLTVEACWIHRRFLPRRPVWWEDSLSVVPALRTLASIVSSS